MCLLAYHHLPIRGLLPPIASVILFRSLTKDLTGGFPPRIATSWFIAFPDALTYAMFFHHAQHHPTILPTTYISPPPPYVPPEQLTLWVDIPYSATADVSVPVLVSPSLYQPFILWVYGVLFNCYTSVYFENVESSQFSEPDECYSIKVLYD
uniref:Uncharacterized protein n=1 Tax=Lactuca sativa TaxID=4236 RepID=A0A9R1VTE3_LACSA|nr:hypothetical protein LSAT_V11C400208120 [Lactuca sativa]